MTDKELIRKVAQEIMGIDMSKPSEYIVFDCSFNPLTNLNHAFQVVERMRELGFECRIDICKELIRVFFFKNSMYSKNAIPDGYHCQLLKEGIGHAVCEAAIAAIRGK